MSRKLRWAWIAIVVLAVLGAAALVRRGGHEEMLVREAAADCRASINTPGPADAGGYELVTSDPNHDLRFLCTSIDDGSIGDADRAAAWVLGGAAIGAMIGAGAVYRRSKRQPATGSV